MFNRRKRKEEIKRNGTSQKSNEISAVNLKIFFFFISLFLSEQMCITCPPFKFINELRMENETVETVITLKRHAHTHTHTDKTISERFSRHQYEKPRSDDDEKEEKN